MYKFQMVMQKIICFATLIACVLTFIFALGFSTDIRAILYPGISQRGNKFAGAELYTEFQPINKELIKTTVLLIVLSLVLFITCCHSRRRYYIGNYIASIVCPIINIVVSINRISIINNCRNRFLTEVDFQKIHELATANSASASKFTDSNSTLWFDLEKAMFILLIVVSVLVVINLIWKLILMIQEKNILKTSKEAC